MTEVWDRAAARQDLTGDPLAWMAARIKVHDQGGFRPWSLDGHEYLQGILADRARHRVIRKAAQLGVSTLAVGEALRIAAAGRNLGYYLPDETTMHTFVQHRFDPTINADAALTALVTDLDPEVFPGAAKRKGKRAADSVRIKQIGGNGGTLFFFGTHSPRGTMTFPMDARIRDEYNALDAEYVEYIEDRTLHSDLNLAIDFGVPSLPGLGIDELFRHSDQKHWGLWCRRCRAWRHPELAPLESLCLRRHGRTETLGETTVTVLKSGDECWLACHRCKAQLKRPSDGGRAAWIAHGPAGAAISGYALSQLYGPVITPERLVSDYLRARGHRTRLARWMRSIAGVPFAGDDQPVTDELLTALRGRGPETMWRTAEGALRAYPGSRFFAGVDQGDLWHLWVWAVSPERGIQTVLLESGGDYGDLEARLDAYDPVFLMDALPNKVTATAIVAKRPRGALAFLKDAGEESGTVVRAAEKSKSGVPEASFNRTELFDDFSDALHGPQVALPTGRLSESMTAGEHLKKMVRVRDEERGIYRYARRVENHYAVAGALGLRALRHAGDLRLAPTPPLPPLEDLFVGTSSIAREV